MADMSGRAAKLAEFSAMAVGPGSWPGDGTGDGKGIVLLSRLEPASTRHLLDVLSLIEAPARVIKQAQYWINLHASGYTDAEASSEPGAAATPSSEHQAAWLRIRGVKDGPWNLTAIGEWDDPEDAQMARELGMAVPTEVAKSLHECARYFGTRRLRWTALVFGSAADLSQARLISQDLVAGLAKPGEQQTFPKIGIARPGAGTKQKLVVEVSREEVEDGNLCGVSLGLDAFTIEQGPALIERMCGAVVIAIAGFDDDRREIYEIPQARDFLAEIALSRPWIILLCEPDFFHVWAAVLDEDSKAVQLGGGRTMVHLSADGVELMEQLVRSGIHELVFEYLMLDKLPAKIAQAYQDWTAFANEHRRLHRDLGLGTALDTALDTGAVAANGSKLDGSEPETVPSGGNTAARDDEDDNQEEGSDGPVAQEGEPGAANRREDGAQRGQPRQSGQGARDGVTGEGRTAAGDRVTSGKGGSDGGAGGGTEAAKRPRPGQREADFWASVVEMSAPGWMATVDPDIGPSIGLSSLETFIYAVDTRTGWVNAAGFTAAQAAEVVEKVRAVSQDGQDLVNTAITQITELAQQCADLASTDSKLAVLAALGAMSFTQTMQMVLNHQGNLKGSFIYLVYTPSRGEPFGRPLFAMPDDPGVIKLDVLFELIGERMRSDILVPGTSMHARIQDCGPLRVCEALQAIIER